jgi:hypothetical protein
LGNLSPAFSQRFGIEEILPDFRDGHYQSAMMKKLFVCSAMLMAWSGLVVQYILILQRSDGSALGNTIEYLSYFTILTNLIVALHYSFIFFDVRSAQIFTRPESTAAIATYIAIVGIIYNLILRSLWDPQGWQRVADELLHLATPVLFVLYWLFVADKKGLQWKIIFSWMIYPVVYLAYTLLRGSLVHWYPYPFIDVDELGYPGALMNCLYVCGAFFGVASLVIGIGRRMA